VSRLVLLCAVSALAVAGGDGARAAEQAAQAPAPVAEVDGTTGTAGGAGQQMVNSQGSRASMPMATVSMMQPAKSWSMPTPIKGVVKADQPPIVTLDEEEIASYGVSSIQDLLSVLAPQTGSGRGRSSDGPVILLNGMRISNFREMRGCRPRRSAGLKCCPRKWR
jgi:hypothetical protein